MGMMTKKEPIHQLNLWFSSDPTLANQAVQLEPVTVDAINFVDFQTNQMVVDRDPWADRMRFWDDILNDHFIFNKNHVSRSANKMD